MFEFNKLCGELEKLTPVERGILLTEKSATVLHGLKELKTDIDPVVALAAFIIGSVVSDGVINEKDYIYIYPQLVKAFGAEFDFTTIKQSYKVAKDIKKELSRHTEELLSIINSVDEQLGNDIISLCLIVTSVDGKISLKEKRYIKKLCKA